MYNVTFKSDVLMHVISINRQINITLIIPRFSVANSLTKNQFHIPLFSIPRRAERTMCLYIERSKNERGRRREAGGKEGEGRGRVGGKGREDGGREEREGKGKKGGSTSACPPPSPSPSLHPILLPGFLVAFVIARIRDAAVKREKCEKSRRLVYQPRRHMAPKNTLTAESR